MTEGAAVMTEGAAVMTEGDAGMTERDTGMTIICHSGSGRRFIATSSAIMNKKK